MERDSLQRFLFENTAVRGNAVHLNITLNQALQYHNYPAPLRTLLGELMAASALLSATLKMEGVLIIQIQGKGPLKLLVVECTNDLGIRATAKWSGHLPDDFKLMIGDGRCAITIDPKGGDAYQGIVPIDGESIVEMLEGYMLRSQQIETRLWLDCDGENAAGMLLQKLPEQPEQDEDAWNRICILADTVTKEELQMLSPETLLTQLFGEEDVRLFSPRPTQFYCGCTRNKVANMLYMLGKDELEDILKERDKIEVNCDFCNKQYLFDAIDAAALLTAEPVIVAGQSVH